jgi:hypothetical protein
MRLPPDVQGRFVAAINKLAALNAPLTDPGIKALVLLLVQEAYRAGVVEMQTPIKIWEDGSGPEDVKT